MSNTKSPERRRTLRARVIVALGTLVLGALLLVAAEGVVRLTTELPLLGNSATLFAAKRFGSSTGNARGAEAISFGQTVYLDQDGFRVPWPGYRSAATRALLLVGDSVAFGPGVAEPETLAGRLRLRFASWNVLDAAVIGHAVPDYGNVVRTVLGERDDVRQVVLVYCLNDLSSASAQEIRALLVGFVGEEALPAAPPATWIERLRSVGMIARANELLRERSKLYLLLRNELTDPPRLYFAADLAPYSHGEEAVFAALAPLAEIADLLRARAIPFTVVVSPYAWQVREPARGEDSAELLPQRLVLRFLAGHQIRAIDATETLRPLGSAAFLPYDPMHLSSAGHAALTGLLDDLLAE